MQHANTYSATHAATAWPRTNYHWGGCMCQHMSSHANAWWPIPPSGPVWEQAQWAHAILHDSVFRNRRHCWVMRLLHTSLLGPRCRHSSFIQCLLLRCLGPASSRFLGRFHQSLVPPLQWPRGHAALFHQKLRGALCAACVLQVSQAL